MSLSAAPHLVIFDCDGVLVDSEPITNQILVDNLARYDLQVSLADCMTLFVGGTMRGVETRARELGADLPKNWIDEIYGDIYARLRQGLPSVRGIEAVLDRLEAADIPYCVASNGSEEKMEITLGATGLARRFEGNRFSAHTLGVAKPDPRLFLIAAEKMGGDAAHAAVIEDSPTGAKAAARAHIPCFGYAEHDDGARLAAEGAYVFHDMADLPALLRLP